MPKQYMVRRAVDLHDRSALERDLLRAHKHVGRHIERQRVKLLVPDVLLRQNGRESRALRVVVGLGQTVAELHARGVDAVIVPVKRRYRRDKAILRQIAPAPAEHAPRSDVLTVPHCEYDVSRAGADL